VGGFICLWLLLSGLDVGWEVLGKMRNGCVGMLVFGVLACSRRLIASSVLACSSYTRVSCARYTPCINQQIAVLSMAASLAIESLQ
jgi:hypothetical protein